MTATEQAFETKGDQVSNQAFKSLREAARAIGCSHELLRRATKGLVGPGLECREVDGVACLDPQTAFEYVQAHAKRRPKELHAPGTVASPVDGQSDAQTARTFRPHSHTLQDPEIAALLEGQEAGDVDPHALAFKAVMAGVSTEKIKALVLVANAQQRKRDAAARAGRNLPPEDVTRMLRAHGELYVEEIEAAAPRFVSELLDMLRKSLGVDPLRAHPDAAKLLQNLVHEQICNAAIVAVRRRVAEQCKGIKLLELTQ